MLARVASVQIGSRCTYVVRPFRVVARLQSNKALSSAQLRAIRSVDLLPFHLPKGHIASHSRAQVTVAATAASRSNNSSNSSSMTPSLVSAAWLKENLPKGGIKVMDGTWYMPNAPNNAVEEFKAERIPGSSIFLPDSIADPSSGLPHMLPTPEAFASAVGAMGVTNDTHVVVYDRHGVFSAPRVWWTFRVMGHDKVSVLEGGLPAWKAAGGELETAPVPEGEAAKAGIAPELSAPAGSFAASKDPCKVRSLKQVWDNVEAAADQVVDARSSGRFYGTAPEPRAGMRGGHIPGSKSVPFDEVLLEGKTGLKAPEEIRAIFEGAGLQLDSSKPIVASCGSGMTACVLALALDQIGQPLTAVYDGSWTEWGSREDVPVVKEG